LDELEENTILTNCTLTHENDKGVVEEEDVTVTRSGNENVDIEGMLETDWE
jgi:hypothetical protein